MKWCVIAFYCRCQIPFSGHMDSCILTRFKTDCYWKPRRENKLNRSRKWKERECSRYKRKIYHEYSLCKLVTFINMTIRYMQFKFSEITNNYVLTKFRINFVFANNSLISKLSAYVNEAKNDSWKICLHHYVAQNVADSLTGCSQYFIGCSKWHCTGTPLFRHQLYMDIITFPLGFRIELVPLCY